MSFYSGLYFCNRFSHRHHAGCKANLEVPQINILPLTCLLQVLDADVVHREESCRGSVLWTHVGDGGSVSNGQLGHTLAEKFHKLPHYAHLPEVLEVQRRMPVREDKEKREVMILWLKNYLCDSEHDVSGGDEPVGGPVQLIAHHLRQHHAYWLTQHNGLRFNASDT